MKQAHTADHVLVSGCAACADFRCARSIAHFFRVTSTEAKDTNKASGTDEEKPASIATSGSPPSGAVASTGTSAGSASSHDITATTVIGAFWDRGARVSLTALRAGPTRMCAESAPCFALPQKGYPCNKLRPMRCRESTPNISARSGENGAEEGQPARGAHTWASGRVMARLPNQRLALRTQRQE